MLNPTEFRLGNYLMHKTGVRILTMPCSFQHLELMAKDGGKDLYPLALSATVLEKCAFVENKKYAGLPTSREFSLVLPIQGSGDATIKAYVKSNKECFARAMMTNLPLSNNLQQLHQVQNLYAALVGAEMPVKL